MSQISVDYTLEERTEGAICREETKIEFDMNEYIDMGLAFYDKAISSESKPKVAPEEARRI